MLQRGANLSNIQNSALKSHLVVILTNNNIFFCWNITICWQINHSTYFNQWVKYAEWGNFIYFPNFCFTVPSTGHCEWSGVPQTFIWFNMWFWTTTLELGGTMWFLDRPIFFDYSFFVHIGIRLLTLMRPSTAWINRSLN